MSIRLRTLIAFVLIALLGCVRKADLTILPVPENVRAYSRQLRADLYWGEGDLWRTDKQLYYEVQRADTEEGPFETIERLHPTEPIAEEKVSMK
ncbi:MAG: hypothetical protein HN341_12105 [Verrucomicrobia bacterium]|jgi:hypothetical protein|nr:hypothetical protein [Verrucomicrobiota bacterium]